MPAPPSKPVTTKSRQTPKSSDPPSTPAPGGQPEQSIPSGDITMGEAEPAPASFTSTITTTTTVPPVIGTTVPPVSGTPATTVTVTPAGSNPNDKAPPPPPHTPLGKTKTIDLSSENDDDHDMSDDDMGIPQTLPRLSTSNFSREDLAIWSTWYFTIHNLDDSTLTSARDQGKLIIEKLGTVMLPPPPFPPSDSNSPSTPIDMSKVMVYNANTASTRAPSAVSIGFSPDDLQAGTVDKRALWEILKAVKKRGWEAAPAEAAGNARCTMINYDIFPPTDHNHNHPWSKTCTRQFARDNIEVIAHRIGCKVSSDWGFYFNNRSGVARGNFADNSPSNTLKLLDLEDSPFSNGSVCRFVTPKFIMPTYFTTMALFVGSDIRVSDENYKNELNNRAAMYNQTGNGNLNEFIMRFRRSADDRFILFDPSHPTLAKFLSSTPLTNGFFPTAVYDMNDKGTNFLTESIVKDRDERMKKHEVKSFHDKHEGAIGAKFDAMEKRTDDKITVLQQGTAAGFSIMMEQRSTESLESEARVIVRSLQELEAISRIRALSAEEEIRKEGNIAHLKDVRSHITLNKDNNAEILKRLTGSAGFVLSAPPRFKSNKIVSGRAPKTPSTALGNMSLGSPRRFTPY